MKKIHIAAIFYTIIMQHPVLAATISADSGVRWTMTYDGTFTENDIVVAKESFAGSTAAAAFDCTYNGEEVRWTSSNIAKDLKRVSPGPITLSCAYKRSSGGSYLLGLNLYKCSSLDDNVDLCENLKRRVWDTGVLVTLTSSYNPEVDLSKGTASLINEITSSDAGVNPGVILTFAGEICISEGSECVSVDVINGEGGTILPMNGNQYILNGPTSLKADWTNAKGGKYSGTATITLTEL
jgi:hypothetical protein